MNRSYSQTYSHIDLDERRKIERWRSAKVSIDVIAEKLGRHRSTIFRELKRNKYEDTDMPSWDGYYCLTANDKAQRRRYNLSKLKRHPGLRDAIVERLQRRMVARTDCRSIETRTRSRTASASSCLS